MKPYWWRPKRFTNFGDELNWFILDQLGIEYEWADKQHADLLVVGSTLDRMPKHWVGTVAGAGNKHEQSRVDLAGSNVVALRGKLTLEHCEGITETPVLGDPGLLVSLLVDRPPIQHDMGVVAHWSDNQLAQRFPEAHVIDVRKPPLQVIREIGSCERIVSSSLHGVIVADSYRIPRRAELYARATEHPDKEGGDFKWRDYASIYDTTPRFGRTWQAPETDLEGLYYAIASIA